MIKFIGIFLYLWQIFINGINGNDTSIFISIIAIILGILVSVFLKYKLYTIIVRIAIVLLAVFFILNFLRATVTLICILYFLVIFLITITICYFMRRQGRRQGE